MTNFWGPSESNAFIFVCEARKHTQLHFVAAY